MSANFSSAHITDLYSTCIILTYDDHIKDRTDCIPCLPAPTNKKTVQMFFSVCVQGNTLQEGLFGLFRLYGCWCVCSLLLWPPLSHLLPLISMETGPGAFSHIHTLPINQQVRPGSIPTHTHHTDENKAHTQTQRLITETSQSTL